MLQLELVAIVRGTFLNLRSAISSFYSFGDMVSMLHSQCYNDLDVVLRSRTTTVRLTVRRVKTEMIEMVGCDVVEENRPLRMTVRNRFLQLFLFFLFSIRTNINQKEGDG